MRNNQVDVAAVHGNVGIALLPGGCERVGEKLVALASDNFDIEALRPADFLQLLHALGICRAFGEHCLDLVLDNVVCRLFDIRICNLGVRADTLRCNDVHVVAMGEIVECVMRRDEVALTLGNLCNLLCDLRIKRIQIGKILL